MPHPGFQTNKIKEKELAKRRELITKNEGGGMPWSKMSGTGLAGTQRWAPRYTRRSLVSTQSDPDPESGRDRGRDRGRDMVGRGTPTETARHPERETRTLSNPGKCTGLYSHRKPEPGSG